MTGADREYCRPCIYVGQAGGTMICDYSAHTGRCRSVVCPSGVGCTLRETKRPKRRRNRTRLNAIDKSAQTGIAKKDYARIDKARALELHRDGLNDGEIARVFGCTPAAVRFWRNAYGLPSNYAPGNPKFKKEENLQ